MFIAMACLCVLLGGPSYAAGAESLIIAGATYYEPGVSGPDWAWTDADHLELNGYTGEAIGADGVVDADGSVAARAVIEPEGSAGPAGESDVRGVPGDGIGEPAADDNPAADQPGAGSAADPVVKPVATSPKTTATKTTATKTTVTKTTVSKTTKPKSTMATTPPLPKTGDSYWIAASITLFLLGTVLLSAAYRWLMRYDAPGYDTRAL